MTLALAHPVAKLPAGMCLLPMQFRKFSKFRSFALRVSLPGVFVMLVAMLASSMSATAETKMPEVFAAYLEHDKTVSGEIGAITPPEELKKYIAKVKASAEADPAWHAEYTKKATPGIPLPWHEKLGLTEEEYADYLKLWDQREFKTLQRVVIRLEEPKPGEWMIRVSGVGMSISLLRFNPETGTFKSPNGELKRIEDIDANERSILGAWAGQEWRYEYSDDFISTKENLALGKYKDGKYCLLIYRLQESASGRRLADKSLVIRFAPPKK